MDHLLRSALPLSVNLNCYTTKVATHIKLPLPRSVLPESRPFEVTTLWRGKGGEEERVRGVRSWWGKWGNQRVILWGFDTGEWLTAGFYTCGPHTCRGVHYYKYIINERLIDLKGRVLHFKSFVVESSSTLRGVIRKIHSLYSSFLIWQTTIVVLKINSRFNFFTNYYLSISKLL
jgi:hypothetical protein